MAERFHLNSAQIRKDLACFGEFGTRGVGYDVSRLKAQLVETLGIDRTRNVIIVGAGNLGMALADYAGFNTQRLPHRRHDRRRSRRRSAARRAQGIPVHAVGPASPTIVRTNRVEIGIIAVPAEGAQTVYDALADAGIHAILNFAPVQLSLRPDVKVKSVDLRINLESLSFHLKNVEDGIV